MRGLEFDARELGDLLVAWAALALAFTFFFERGVLADPATALSMEFLWALALNAGTVGVAFLLHELAHKVVAVHYDQRAAFRADYGMLFVAVMGGLAGFIFAAPGAVHHRGWLTEREGALIALAGPATNIVLTGVFVAIAAFEPVLWRGVWVNALLAAFNLLPIGGLDGRRVLDYSKPMYAASMGVAVALAVVVFLS